MDNCENLKESKLALRKVYKGHRNNMSEDEVRIKSEKIIRKFVASKLYRESWVLFTYVSMGKEVNTMSLIEKGFVDGKKVVVPKVVGKRKLTFYYINSFDDLEPSIYNLLEPKGTCEVAKLLPQIIVIPGLAFDLKKNRLGYGGGYYDSYLAGCSQAAKIAFAYDFQIVDDVPINEFDVKVDRIITDERVISYENLYKTLPLF